MNISDLVDAVAATDSKLTKAQAKAAIEATFAAIRDAAAKGDEVSVPGFGKFAVQSKPARTGRNPSTGATIEIAASKALVDAVAWRQIDHALMEDTARRIAQARVSEEGREGVAAFLARRQPSWAGQG